MRYFVILLLVISATCFVIFADATSPEDVVGLLQQENNSTRSTNNTNNKNRTDQDIGLCLGVADGSAGDEDDKNDDNNKGNSPTPRCRDYDRDEYACNELINGCWWIRLPSCNGGPCVDLYTTDEETTSLFVGTLVAAAILVCCCMTGWLTVACCGCACTRRRLRARKEVREREQVQRVLEARNNGEFFQVDEENDPASVTPVFIDESLQLEEEEDGVFHSNSNHDERPSSRDDQNTTTTTTTTTTSSTARLMLPNRSRVATVQIF